MAMELMKQSADLGNSEAQLKLGGMYSFGGMGEDKPTADHYDHLAAYQLGVFFFEGFGGLTKSNYV